MSGLEFEWSRYESMFGSYSYWASARMKGGTLVVVQGYNMADRVDVSIGPRPDRFQALCLSCAGARALAAQLVAAAESCEAARGGVGS